MTSAAAASLLEVEEEVEEEEVMSSPSKKGRGGLINSPQLSSLASRNPSAVCSAAKSTCPRASSRLPDEREARTAEIGNDLFDGGGDDETEFEFDEFDDDDDLARVLSLRRLRSDVEGPHSGSLGVEARKRWLCSGNREEDEGAAGRGGRGSVGVAALHRGATSEDANPCLLPAPPPRPLACLMAHRLNPL